MLQGALLKAAKYSNMVMRLKDSPNLPKIMFSVIDHQTLNREYELCFKYTKPLCTLRTNI